MEETKTMEAPQAATIGAEQVKKLTEVLQKYKTGKKRNSPQQKNPRLLRISPENKRIAGAR